MQSKSESVQQQHNSHFHFPNQTSLVCAGGLLWQWVESSRQGSEPGKVGTQVWCQGELNMKKYTKNINMRNVSGYEPGKIWTQVWCLKECQIKIICFKNPQLIYEFFETCTFNCGFSSNWVLPYFPLSVRHRRDISHFSHIKRHKCHVNH